MADNRDIIVRIKSDASDMLKGYERAIGELEKYANKAQPFNEMQSDIDELRQGINELKTSIKSIGSDKIDSSQLDKLMQKLDSQAEKIRQLQKNQNKIKIEVDETSGKRLNDIVSNAENKLNQLKCGIYYINIPNDLIEIYLNNMESISDKVLNIIKNELLQGNLIYLRLKEIPPEDLITHDLLQIVPVDEEIVNVAKKVYREKNFTEDINRVEKIEII